MCLLRRRLEVVESLRNRFGRSVAGTREVAWDRVVLNEFDRFGDDSDCGQKVDRTGEERKPK